MKRRFGMIFSIILILIVGVSVTKMTINYVASQGVAASSMIRIADRKEEKADLRFEKEAAIPAMGAPAETQAPMMASPGAGASTDMVSPAMASPVVEESYAEPERIVMNTEAAVITETFESEHADLKAKPEALRNEAIEETVKSPLDPVVEVKPVLSDVGDPVSMRTSEDFFARFAAAENSSVKIWEMASTDNLVAYAAAAEQERVLWDYELNLIYGEIRSRMSKEEAESLKHLELEWIKERDMYAEKMASKSPATNGQKQDPAYIRSLAEKTKERCYWLVSEYEEILNNPLLEAKMPEVEKN